MMTVQDLIQILQTLDPSHEVRIQHPYLDETAPIENGVLVDSDTNVAVLYAAF